LNFEQQVRQYLDKHNHEALINYLQMGEAARLAVQTDEHYLQSEMT
jgi:aromatic ring-opening dioxygenase catalytic subunit (LigB family)